MGLQNMPPPQQSAAPLAVTRGAPVHVAGHWTAEDLSLDLLDGRGFPLQTIRGPGLRHAATSSAQTLAAMLADWDQRYGLLPVLLSGLAEIPAGWRKADPTVCPIAVEEIPGTVVRFTAQDRTVGLVPGLTCLSRMGCSDYLWGEETILAGAASLYPDLLHGAKAVCVPGPRTRWIILRHGRVLHFTTSLQGEVFRLLADDPPAGNSRNRIIQPDIFQRGMQEADCNEIDLLYLLHQARCRNLDGEITAADIPSFLLGLLLRREVAAADRLLRLGKRSSVVLIADEMQAYLYGRAFEAQGLGAAVVDRSRAITAGLYRIATACA